MRGSEEGRGPDSHNVVYDHADRDAAVCLEDLECIRAAGDGHCLHIQT